MFVFHFYNRLQWCNRLFKNEFSSLWKITISGPFVTLYSSYEYMSILKNYSIIRPFFIEHMQAHGENLLENIFPSELRNTHTHLTLPCKDNLIVELRELLTLIEEHNETNEKLIDSRLIETCIGEYENYLNSASLDEHKKNAASLLMKWIAPYLNYYQLNFTNAFSNPVTVKNTNLLDLSNIDLEITQYLNHPNQNSFELLRKEVFHSLQTLNYSPDLKRDLKNIVDLMPITSTNIFNKFVNEHLFVISGSLFFSWISILLGCKLVSNEETPILGLFITFFLCMYAPLLIEKFYTSISASINNENLNPKLSEIMEKQKDIEVDHETELRTMSL